MGLFDRIFLTKIALEIVNVRVVIGKKFFKKVRKKFKFSKAKRRVRTHIGETLFWRYKLWTC